MPFMNARIGFGINPLSPRRHAGNGFEFKLITVRPQSVTTTSSFKFTTTSVGKNRMDNARNNAFRATTLVPSSSDATAPSRTRTRVKFDPSNPAYAVDDASHAIATTRTSCAFANAINVGANLLHAPQSFDVKYNNATSSASPNARGASRSSTNRNARTARMTSNDPDARADDDDDDDDDDEHARARSMIPNACQAQGRRDWRENARETLSEMARDNALDEARREAEALASSRRRFLDGGDRQGGRADGEPHDWNAYYARKYLKGRDGGQRKSRSRSRSQSPRRRRHRSRSRSREQRHSQHRHRESGRKRRERSLSRSRSDDRDNDIERRRYRRSSPRNREQSRSRERAYRGRR
mmetsp:Transcript_7609/g.27854  ORF Transcript_7609/g.27854 Transcript_7609/m.27854 type:complete len:354 (-) Transcript_7609:621-1682(-)